MESMRCKPAIWQNTAERGSLLVIFSTFGTVFMFGTPVAFGTLRIGSVFSTLGIIPSEFWYIGVTFVHFTSTSYSSTHS